MLQRQSVLRQRLLLPYVPLLGAGSANVPAMKILNGEVLRKHRDLQCLSPVIAVFCSVNYNFLKLFSQFRVQKVAQSIADEVGSHCHCKDCQSREACYPEFVEVLNTIGYHHTPFRCWRCGTEAQGQEKDRSRERER